jgi:hypothetical protein
MDALIETLFQAVLSEEDKPLADRHWQVKDRILKTERTGCECRLFLSPRR